MIEKAHRCKGSPSIERMYQRVMRATCVHLVFDRRDAELLPKRGTRVGMQDEPILRPTQTTGQVFHDDIVVAVTDEKCRVAAEHPFQEAGSPRIRQVGPAEISVCEN